ncbi:MAG: M28 family peptidase, partial [Muribaculaceae bacterium]|nr:M28 family peptidase [Muribaculaceae bacterium]
MRQVIIILFVVVALCACSGGNASARTEGAHAEQSRMPFDAFDADSAYANVASQVAMGPRTPGSEGARGCARWAAGRLRAAGADTVAVLPATVRRFDGQELMLENVYASFNPEAGRRVLLMAHYDTRPWADMEPDAAMRMQPIPGANDGASGVGVLLEIA